MGKRFITYLLQQMLFAGTQIFDPYKLLIAEQQKKGVDKYQTSWHPSDSWKLRARSTLVSGSFHTIKVAKYLLVFYYPTLYK